MKPPASLWTGSLPIRLAILLGLEVEQMTDQREFAWRMFTADLYTAGGRTAPAPNPKWL